MPFRRARTLWRTLTRSAQLDADMRDEMRLHVELETERLVRERALDPEEARRQAHVAFGGIEKYRREGRQTRRLHWMDALSLDTRLGVRMLIKYPWLTLVGSFAIAVAIAVGASLFETVNVLLYSTLPIDEGDRVVAVQYGSSAASTVERHVSHDFVEWRQQLTSIEELGAFRTVEHNLTAAGRQPEPVRVAQITAAGFLVARTPPLFGRYLIADDERDGAEPVVVIGHDEWRQRFFADAGIVGRSIVLGGTAYVVVGVMPQGFRFPLDDQFWIPLRVNPLQHPRLQGPELHVFGRLAAGVSLEQAQAELTASGQRTAAQHPELYARLQPRIVPYTRAHMEVDEPMVAWGLSILQLVISGLLIVVAVNLAILVYARTVARMGELAVRSALGASRRRIVIQLFVEACALAVIGAVIGVAITSVALDWIQMMFIANMRVPFWIRFDVSFASIGYALGLALLAAAIVGILPGVRTTGRRLHDRLRELGGSSSASLGRTWTFLIVAQVAIAVAILPLAIFTVWEVVRTEVTRATGPADEILLAQFGLGTDAKASATSQPAQREAARVRHLDFMNRLAAEPGVAGVNFSGGIPGFVEPGGQIEFDVRRPGAESDEAEEVNVLRVGVGTFELYGAAILAGRSLESRDFASANTVVVNRTFARSLLGNTPALGQRFRYVAAPGEPPRPWQEIVGVVEDFPAFPPLPGRGDQPRVYHAAALGETLATVVSVRVKGMRAEDFVARVREIGAEVDPAVPLRNIRPLTTYYTELRALWRFIAWGLALVTTSVLLLSAAGIYALMSFVVTQRTREIGIRAALGAPPRRVLFGVFGRAMRQLVYGAMLGAAIAAVLLRALGLSGERVPGLLLAVAAIVLVVGLLGALGPAHRALSINATEALRAGA